jgi:transglutaminase/protease-like cytokinesis protein 3
MGWTLYLGSFLIFFLSIIFYFIAQSPNVNLHQSTAEIIAIKVADSEAFNHLFIQQRQQAIDNISYRSTIESWQPDSLQQFTEIIKTFSKEKPLIDLHLIIFYWIAYNIEYDVVSYFAKDYKDQTAEAVFRNKKGVCAGYANLYKYLCDQLQIPCEIVSGYSKGYGFDDREEAPSETDHAWNAVQIGSHWYLMESTWGAGHLSKEKTFERQFNSYYFLPRPNEMIYHHLPENDKWQLLQAPINMVQYMQMPKIHPTYFELDLELVSPRNQAHVDFLPDKPYALVLVRAPSHVRLIADLKLNDEKVEAGHRVVFDNQKQIYCCYFAPSTVGKHQITIYGKHDDEKGD